MPLVYHPVRIPCAVYVREGRHYRFSHCCRPRPPRKAIPGSLRVRDLQEYSRQPPLLATLRKSCFLVLVAGDVAQCVSVDNAGEHAQRVRFLYRGSEYAQRTREGQQGGGSEFHEDYVPLCFHTTLAFYGMRDGLLSVRELECGIALFPRCICERDLPTLARWTDHNLAKAVHGSVWLSEGSESYNEHSSARKRRRVSDKCSTEIT
jgi:hypothetical protein